jgi:hypothetical protein
LSGVEWLARAFGELSTQRLLDGGPVPVLAALQYQQAFRLPQWLPDAVRAIDIGLKATVRAKPDERNR